MKTGPLKIRKLRFFTGCPSLSYEISREDTHQSGLDGLSFSKHFAQVVQLCAPHSVLSAGKMRVQRMSRSHAKLKKSDPSVGYIVSN